MSAKNVLFIIVLLPKIFKFCPQYHFRIMRSLILISVGVLGIQGQANFGGSSSSRRGSSSSSSSSSSSNSDNKVHAVSSLLAVVQCTQKPQGC